MGKVEAEAEGKGKERKRERKGKIFFFSSFFAENRFDV
jgi:YHS domain-containing protein